MSLQCFGHAGSFQVLSVYADRQYQLSSLEALDFLHIPFVKYKSSTGSMPSGPRPVQPSCCKGRD